MRAFLLQFVVSLRLHFRNRMALIYGYIFPTIFLVAFWVLYRYETPPLLRHMGELLTVTVLGGACFGLPTTLVSERERGVWRRYRLTPVRTGSVVASTVVARYVLLLGAGLVQVLLAMLIGMPAPRHIFDLWVAFTCVAFAFMGLGLVIATLADNVPAVQALGQTIFLPMLIIGGVAVPLASLPVWAQHVSAFFPGRYAVESIRAAVMGDGIAPARVSLLALLLIGAAGFVVGSRLFRWDSEQRFSAMPGRGWVAAALVAWAAVGATTEMLHRAPVRSAAIPAPIAATPAAPLASPQPSTDGAPSAAPQAPAAAAAPPAGPVPAPAAAARSAAEATARPSPAAPTVPAPKRDDGAVPAGSAPPTPTPKPAAAPATPEWQRTTLADIDREIDFTRVPPDSGVVVPIAPMMEDPPPDVIDQLEGVRTRLPDWAPGKAPDLVQRTRNLLYVAAVPDVFQAPVERYVPILVYQRLQEDIPAAQLIQVLYLDCAASDGRQRFSRRRAAAAGAGLRRRRPRRDEEPRGVLCSEAARPADRQDRAEVTRRALPEDRRAEESACAFLGQAHAWRGHASPPSRRGTRGPAPKTIRLYRTITAATPCGRTPSGSTGSVYTDRALCERRPAPPTSSTFRLLPEPSGVASDARCVTTYRY